MVGIGKILLGSPLAGVACLAIFIFTLWLTIRRINQDFDTEETQVAACIQTRKNEEVVHGNTASQDSKAANMVR